MKLDKKLSQYFSDIGTRGGEATTGAKVQAAQTNLAKARAARSAKARKWRERKIAA